MQIHAHPHLHTYTVRSWPPRPFYLPQNGPEKIASAKNEHHLHECLTVERACLQMINYVQVAETKVPGILG